MASIWGYVLDDLTYVGINGADVSINSGYGSPNYHTTTDDGYYQITNLAYGTYTLYARAGGFYSKSISGISVPSNNPVYREIDMRKKG